MRKKFKVYYELYSHSDNMAIVEAENENEAADKFNENPRAFINTEFEDVYRDALYINELIDDENDGD